jgi:hypothetical protein
MDKKFTTQYSDEDGIVSAIMTATDSAELTTLQVANRHFLARHPDIHELLIQMSHELRPSFTANGEGWEG